MADLQKKSLTLSGHETSIALEAAFWTVLEDMARSRGVSLVHLIRSVDQDRGSRPLASACRLSALAWALAKTPAITAEDAMR